MQKAEIDSPFTWEPVTTTAPPSTWTADQPGASIEDTVNSMSLGTICTISANDQEVRGIARGLITEFKIIYFDAIRQTLNQRVELS